MTKRNLFNRNQLITDHQLLNFFNKLFSRKIFLIIGRMFSFVWHIFKNITYPFRTWITVIAIIGLAYVTYSGLIMNDYVISHYGSYEKIFCSAGITDKLKNSVVRIVGGDAEGSGFFITGNQIITSFHVIANEPAPKIILPDGKFITPIKISGDQDADLAILYTEDNHSDLVLNMLATHNVTQNEMLAAAGYPLGTNLAGKATVIRGNYLDYRKSRSESVGYIQTNFSLVQGMSGGPLVDMCGYVVGINTFSLSGQSLFISSDAAWKVNPNFTDQDIVKIAYKPENSPEDAVRAYYNYLKARRMEDGYNLLSGKYRENATYDEWSNRFNNIIDVDVVGVKKFEKFQDIAYIKFTTKNWVDGEVEYHYYQGTWKTIKEENIFKMLKSNIEEIKEPDYEWYMDEK